MLGIIAVGRGAVDIVQIRRQGGLDQHGQKIDAGVLVSMGVALVVISWFVK